MLLFYQFLIKFKLYKQFSLQEYFIFITIKQWAMGKTTVELHLFHCVVKVKNQVRQSVDCIREGSTLQSKSAFSHVD